MDINAVYLFKIPVQANNNHTFRALNKAKNVKSVEIVCTKETNLTIARQLCREIADSRMKPYIEYKNYSKLE
jgi:hypothetical protein